MNVKLLKGSSVQVKGNGMTLGLTDGGLNGGLFGTTDGAGTRAIVNKTIYGANIGTVASGEHLTSYKSLGVTTDPEKSGIIADISNGFSANYIIKY